MTARAGASPRNAPASNAARAVADGRGSARRTSRVYDPRAASEAHFGATVVGLAAADAGDGVAALPGDGGREAGADAA